jgi:hypothetical protein
MKCSRAILIVVSCVSLVAACADTVSLVPGADQVRLTKNPTDIANCKPSGNVNVVLGEVYAHNLQGAFRNRVVGLGGNAAMVTYGSLKFPEQGVAYQCP